MNDEIKNDNLVNSEQHDIDNDLSRREFLSRSTGTVVAASAIAAGSAVGLMGAASDASAAVAPPEPESPDTSVRWNTEHGDLYNEKLGYGDRDVTGWKGRYVYGPTVGILQLPANIPM